MSRDKLAKKTHEELVEMVWNYRCNNIPNWQKFAAALLILLISIIFALCLSPTPFHLLSNENINSVGQGVLISNALIIFARALVILSAMYFVLKIFSSDD